MDAETAYNQALDYLYSYVDYSLKKSSELAKAHFDLERMRKLMAVLGNPRGWDEGQRLHLGIDGFGIDNCRV
jgi:hypothetical protein